MILNTFVCIQDVLTFIMQIYFHFNTYGYVISIVWNQALGLVLGLTLSK